MQADYYDLLGIDDKSSQEEIKRAYFKKVRQYSPEKSPEIFTKIREAYDTLKDEDLRKAYDKRNGKSEDERISAAGKSIESHEFKKAIKILKEVLESDPESEQAMAMLADTYMNVGESGNASKVYEKLKNAYPDNQEYAVSFAEALYNRNHSKRAFTQFEKAMEIDVKNPDAWFKWVSTVMDDSELAYKVIGMAEAFSSNMFKDNYMIYGALWLDTVQYTDFPIHTKTKKYSMLKKYIDFYKTDKFPDKHNVDLLLACLREMLEYKDTIDENIMDEGIALLEKTIDSANRFKLDFIEMVYGFSKINKSGKKIDDVIYDLTAMASELKYSEDEETQIRMTEAKVYIITKFSKLRSDIIYLKEKFPKLYALNAVFYEQIMDAAGRKAIERQLGKLIAVNGMDTDLSSVFEDELVIETPFKREQPKVGRNDPCICGSGKKYKKCCGR